jgi:hypothetical protein
MKRMREAASNVGTNRARRVRIKRIMRQVHRGA